MWIVFQHVSHTMDIHLCQDGNWEVLDCKSFTVSEGDVARFLLTVDRRIGFWNSGKLHLQWAWAIMAMVGPPNYPRVAVDNRFRISRQGSALASRNCFCFDSSFSWACRSLFLQKQPWHKNGAWGWTLVVVKWERNYTATICNYEISYLLYSREVGDNRFSEGTAKMGYLGFSSAVRSSWVPLLCRSLRRSSSHGPTDTVHRLPKRRLT